jgi:S1-C subfamily serine protease
LSGGIGRNDIAMAAKMTRLFTTVCVIALTVGAQAKPVQLGLIDNRWVIEYDAELFAGACIATMDSNLLKLKISFITAYPKEGTEKLWFVGLSSPEWTWIKPGTTYDFAIDTKRGSGETKKWPLVFNGGSDGFMFAQANVDIVNSMASDYGDIFFNVRNLKTNQYLAQRDSWNLGKSAAAIRSVVNCLRDRSPTVPTTPAPPPPVPPPPSQKQESKSSVGSGFFVSKPMGSETSYVVTNFHVIDGCKSAIRIRYPVYPPVNAYVHAADPANDLALLATKLSAGGFPSFRLNLKQGEQIASYGFPYGADFASFTMGNVTSVVGLDNNTSAFQLSAPVQPGNSGGPLLDMNGRVVGMAQGILGTLRAAEALGGAIPQNVNIGITATTIIGFLQAHSVDYIIDTERTKFEPEQIADEAKKFTVKVTCGD